MLLVILLSILGLTHVYWAFGGSVGLDVALPTNENGKRLLKTLTQPRYIYDLCCGFCIV